MKYLEINQGESEQNLYEEKLWNFIKRLKGGLNGKT